LLLPDLESALIEDISEGLDVGGGEAAAEVAGGGGVEDAVGAQGVEEDDVVASPLDVVEARSIAQGVVGKVQDVVTLVVREMVLEQMESIVDRPGEPELVDEQLNGTDAPLGDGLGPGGGLVVDIRGGEDRIGRRCGGRLVEAPADFALASDVVSMCGIGFTRNLLGGSAMESVEVDPMCRKNREISSF